MTTGDYRGNHLACRLRAASVGREEKLFAEVNGRRVTYGELFAGAERIAAALTAAGVAPGDRVVAQVEKSIAAVQLYLAAVIAGGVFVPLNPAYTVAEVADHIQDAEPTVLVCDPDNADALGAQFSLAADGSGTLINDAAADTDTVDATVVTDTAATAAVVTADAGDPAALLYTSGTTGRAKGAMLSHANLAVNARALADRWRFTADDVLLHALPLFHTHGLFVAVNVALVAGASLIFLPRFDTAAVINAMPRATVLMGVPTFYSRLLAAGVGKKDAATVRVFISGSAPLPAAVFDEWRVRTGHAIVERYGLTETGINTSNRCDDGLRAGTVGLPLAGVEVRVTDAAGDALPVGEVGAVEVRGQNVFQGYWRRREQTADVFRDDNYFITGDLGCVDARGYLTIAGRAGDLIISGGNNIHPHEVESAINGVTGVRECAVVGVPDPDLGEVAAAVVVTDTVTDADIAAALKTKLARYKHPKKIIRTDQLPRNAMGKVQKNILRERYGASG